MKSREPIRPNIVMITCHDLGRHLGCYGVDSVQSPNIDRLAAQGLRFTNAYCTSPICSPARGSLHTGRYPQSNGLMGLTHAPWWWELHGSERHTAQILSQDGYAAILVGYNHVCPSDPSRLGYASRVSPRCRAEETVEAARQLIKNAESQQQPFFAKVGFREVHRPFQHGSDDSKGVHVPWWLQDTAAMRADLAAFQGDIRFFDARVGEILDAVEESSQAEQTLIIFTSDHGMPYPGAKHSLRRPGIEIPLIFYQPGGFFPGGRTIDALASHIDVLPTLLDYVGCPAPEAIEGVSFMPHLRGDAPAPRAEAFAQFTPDMMRDNTSRCIITNRHHLIRYFDPGRTVEYPVDIDPQKFADHTARCFVREPRPYVRLFDLQKDPEERNDCARDSDYAQTVRELSRRLYDWMKQVNDPLLSGPVSTPYYRRAMEDFRAAAEQ